MAQNLQARLHTRSFFARLVHHSIGILPVELRLVVVGDGCCYFGLRMLQGQLRGILASLKFLHVEGKFRRLSRGGVDLALEEMHASLARFPPTRGSRYLGSQRMKAGFQAGEFRTICRELALHSDALLAYSGKPCAVLIQGRLMLTETLNHLSEQRVRLLDLLLLSADFFLRLADVQSVTINQHRRFSATLMVGLNPILG